MSKATIEKYIKLCDEQITHWHDELRYASTMSAESLHNVDAAFWNKQRTSASINGRVWKDAKQLAKQSLLIY